jgi:aspartokinase
MPWDEKSRVGTPNDGPNISLVKRYSPQEKIGNHESMTKLVLKLTLKNKIVVVALANDPKIPRALARFSAQVDYSRGETLHIVSGIETVKVVTDYKNLGKLTAIVPKKRILNITTDLAEIVISLSDSVINTPGVVATISTHLARSGVNLVEYITCSPHAIVVVEEKDALRSYKLLEDLATGQKELTV